jgi:hypothetical protein
MGCSIDHTCVFVQINIMCLLSVFRLYIGFKADPDLASFLNADQDLNEVLRCEILTSQKAEYIHEKNTLCR